MQEFELKELSTNPHTLIKQIAQAEAVYYLIAERVAQARKVLTEKVAQNQLPKTKDITEMDRKIHLEFKSREEQLNLDVLEEQKNALKQRISVGQTILNYLKEERKVSGINR